MKVFIVLYGDISGSEIIAVYSFKDMAEIHCKGINDQIPAYVQAYASFEEWDVNTPSDGLVKNNNDQG